MTSLQGTFSREQSQFCAIRLRGKVLGRVENRGSLSARPSNRVRICTSMLLQEQRPTVDASHFPYQYPKNDRQVIICLYRPSRYASVRSPLVFFIHARGRLQFLSFLIGFSGRSRRSIGVVLLAALLCIGAVAVAGLLRFGDPSSPVGGGTLHPEASNN